MAKAKIVATYSPCCGIFHVGDAEQGIMHCALPHDRKVVKLVDEKELETLDALKAELKNATIPAICAAWLKANGYDGLCDPEMACGCSVLDLMPCATPRLNTCVPAHKELQDDGDWLMFPGKAGTGENLGFPEELRCVRRPEGGGVQ